MREERRAIRVQVRDFSICPSHNPGTHTPLARANRNAETSTGGNDELRPNFVPSLSSAGGRVRFVPADSGTR